MALGRLTSFTFGNSFLTLVYANSQTYYVSYAHIIAGESDSRSGDLTIWIYTAGEVGETLSVKNSDLVAIGSSATAFLALFNQNIQPYSYWQDFLDSTTASGALPSEPSALRGQCLYARFRPIYNFGSASLINVPARFKAGTLYSQIPESGAGDFTVSRTTTVANRSTRINKDGLIELVNDNVPRLDYPVGGAVNGCPALLVEPAATNGIRNNSMVGAVVGSPGTIPTNWIVGGVGLTQQIVAVGTENGVSYIDLRLSGTATASTATLSFESATQIAALTGQTWTISSYLKTISLPSPPSSFSFAITERTSGGAIVVQQTTNVSLTSNLARYTYSPTLNGGATTAFAQPRLFFVLVVGQTYDFTVRVGYPQMELGSVATSVIPTTTAAVTRSADVIRKTNIASLIGQSEGTVYFEFEVTNEARTRWAATVDSGNNDFIQFFINSSRVLGVSISKAGATVMTTLNSSALSVGYHKVAFAYNAATNGCEMFIDGVQNPVASRTVTGAGLPALSNSTLGSFTTSGSDSLKAHIRAFEIHPNRLTNAQLATLTAL